MPLTKEQELLKATAEGLYGLAVDLEYMGTAKSVRSALVDWVEPEIKFVAVTRTDTEAMDRIHKYLDGVEWTPDTLDQIFGEVLATGRYVRDPDET